MISQACSYKSFQQLWKQIRDFTYCNWQRPSPQLGEVGLGAGRKPERHCSCCKNWRQGVRNCKSRIPRSPSGCKSYVGSGRTFYDVLEMTGFFPSQILKCWSEDVYLVSRRIWDELIWWHWKGRYLNQQMTPENAWTQKLTHRYQWREVRARSTQCTGQQVSWAETKIFCEDKSS